jgi:hypothetical protein
MEETITQAHSLGNKYLSFKRNRWVGSGIEEDAGEVGAGRADRAGGAAGDADN